MKALVLRCDNCGAPLEVDDNRVRCTYCDAVNVIVTVSERPLGEDDVEDKLGPADHQRQAAADLGDAEITGDLRALPPAPPDPDLLRPVDGPARARTTEDIVNNDPRAHEGEQPGPEPGEGNEPKHRHDWLCELRDHEEAAMQAQCPRWSADGVASSWALSLIGRTAFRALRWFHRRLRRIEANLDIDRGEP